MKTKIENDYIQLEIIEDILIATYKVKFITLEIAKNVVFFRKQFIQEINYPVLIKDDKTVKIEKKAREYFASTNGIEGLSSVAVLTNSVYKSTLMNFFTKVLPPKIPVRLFRKEEDAIDWLKKLRPNER